jgi:hypothetical protein
MEKLQIDFDIFEFETDDKTAIFYDKVAHDIELAEVEQAEKDVRKEYKLA